MRKLSIVLTVLISVLLAFVACDNLIDIGLDTKVEVKEIVLNETKLEILTGDEETLVATVLPEDATDKSVTWSSSDEDVATVDANGKVTGVGFGEATITVTSNSDTTVYETCSVKVSVDPYKIPLTLEFINAGEFWIKYNDYDLSLVEYSLNGQAKGELENDQHVKVSAGDIICFFRDVVGARGPAYHVSINCDSQCYVYGNVMSLFKSEGFENLTTVTEESLMGLFYGNTNIKNHDVIDLVLPATQLAEDCYAFMFKGCTGLTRAPELPATQLAEDCYTSMFYGCTSLTTVPDLPADDLASYCCYKMFYGCTSLTTAPELPATILANSCYNSMFQDCTSLTTAPNLPAEQLANSCYAFMFKGCTNLNSITCLATNISEENCTYDWMNHAGSAVASTKTFYKNPDATCWTVGTNVPSDWTITDYVPPTT